MISTYSVASSLNVKVFKDLFFINLQIKNSCFFKFKVFTFVASACAEGRREFPAYIILVSKA